MAQHDGEHTEVDLLAIGAGPSNLALAVALEELAPTLARNSLIIDREHDISWQRSMLMPEVLSNTSFLKDLVTMRNPRSKYTFLNYLHTIGRLDQFVNMASFVPYRIEVANYLKWVAENLSQVRIQLDTECLDTTPTRTNDTITGWETRTNTGQTIHSKYLVIGAGRDPLIPEPLTHINPERIIHSTQYRQRIDTMHKDLPYRIVVLGAGQSAAELFCAVLTDLPECQPTIVMRSVGLGYYETSKFNNELYYPSFIDQFHNARPEARQQILADMRHTNYSGLAPATIEWLYRQFYLDQLTNRDRLRMIRMHHLTTAHDNGHEIILTLTDWRTGTTQQIPADLILLGTGYTPTMPTMIQKLATTIGEPHITVTRNYKLTITQPTTAACYLHGVNETTHGIVDSLLSVLAFRATDIINDIHTHQNTHLTIPTQNHHHTPLTTH